MLIRRLLSRQFCEDFKDGMHTTYARYDKKYEHKLKRDKNENKATNNRNLKQQPAADS